MPSYVVTYDLSAPGRNYDDLIEHMKSYGTYSHPLGSVWLIVTDKTAAQIADAARQYMDSNDKVLVIKASGEAAWANLRTATSEWIHKHL